MKTKNKVLTVVSASVMATSLVVPLASCANLAINKSESAETNKDDIKITCLEPDGKLKMSDGKEGSGKFKATDKKGNDITNSVTWGTIYHHEDYDDIYFTAPGELYWNSSFTHEYAGTASIEIYAYKQYKGDAVFQDIPVDWIGGLELAYDGPKEFEIHRGAKACISATSAMKLSFKGKDLDRSQYSVWAFNISESLFDVSFDENNNLIIDSSNWDGISSNDITFLIKFDYEDEDGYSHSLEVDGWKVHLKNKAEFSFSCSGSWDVVRYSGLSGSTLSQYTIKKDGKDISADPNLKAELWIDGSEFGMEDSILSSDITYNKETKKFEWPPQLTIIQRSYHIYVRAEYTSPESGQTFIGKSKNFKYNDAFIDVEFTGEDGWQNDSTLEFVPHDWSKAIYIQYKEAAGSDVPPIGPENINGVTFDAEEGKSLPAGIDARVEAKDDKHIKIVPFVSNDAAAGEYKMLMCVTFAAVPGAIGVPVYAWLTLNISSNSIKTEGYSNALDGMEHVGGSDANEWKVQFEKGDDKKNLAANCNFELIQDKGSDNIPDGAIYVDKTNGVHTKWTDALDVGTYKFHFKISYNHGDKKTYTVESAGITLSIGAADLQILNVETKLKAAEYVAGATESSLGAQLYWTKGGHDPVPIDPSKVTWEIVGSDKVKNCFFINDNYQIAWKDNINKETLGSGSFQISATYTSDSGHKYTAKSADIKMEEIADAKLSISGGSDKLYAEVGKPGSDKEDKRWVAKLAPGSITDKDNLTYKFVDLPDKLKDKIHINDGLVSWDDNLEKTTSSAPYKFKVQAVLNKDGREEDYTSETHEISLYVSDDSQKIFENMSWKELTDILNDSSQGLAKLKDVLWMSTDETLVGFTKTIKLNVNGEERTYTAKVIGENHDKLYGKDAKAALTFELQELTYVGSPFDDDTNCWNDGSNSSVLRDSLLNYAKTAFPAEVLSSIKAVEKDCATGKEEGGQRKIVKTSETIWLPSATELGATASDDVVWAQEGTIYEYYQQHTDLNARTKILWGEQYKGIYWTRSPSVSRHSMLSACAIWSNGIIDSMYADDRNQYVAPCFCI